VRTLHGFGNVKLTPTILRDSQKYVSEKYGVPANTLNFVFHCGSGSSEAEIRESISYGVIKMNIDTDTHHTVLAHGQYPTAQIEIHEKGMTLFHSLPPVPPRGFVVKKPVAE